MIPEKEVDFEKTIDGYLIQVVEDDLYIKTPAGVQIHIPFHPWKSVKYHIKYCGITCTKSSPIANKIYSEHYDNPWEEVRKDINELVDENINAFPFV